LVRIRFSLMLVLRFSLTKARIFGASISLLNENATGASGFLPGS
jgi:hypothetical protein